MSRALSFSTLNSSTLITLIRSKPLSTYNHTSLKAHGLLSGLVKPFVCNSTQMKSQLGCFLTACFIMQPNYADFKLLMQSSNYNPISCQLQANIIFRLAGKLCPRMHHFLRCDNCLLNYNAIVSTCFLNLIKGKCNHECGPEMWTAVL